MGCTNSSALDSQENISRNQPQVFSPNKSIQSSGSIPTKFVDIYHIGEVLGQGSYSVVRIATRIKDGLKVAVKIVSRHKLLPEDELSLRSEVEVLRSLDHPNIVRVLDFIEEKHNFYLVLEYVEGGELFERLVEKAVYTENEARDISITLLKTIKYCHDRGVIHRDLKPENILLLSKSDDINMKLADFGFAIKADGPIIKQQAGTPGYIAPEIIENKSHGKPVDMWSLGVIIFMLIGGYPPFYESSDNIKALYRKILRADFQFHPERWSNVSDEAKDLIKGLLTLDSQKRLTVEQALSHPWIYKPSEELICRNLDRNIGNLRNYFPRLNAKNVASVAIDVMKKLSNTNLNKPVKINDVAIDAIRKLSGANLNESLIEVARKRSGANVNRSKI